MITASLKAHPHIRSKAGHRQETQDLSSNGYPYPVNAVAIYCQSPKNNFMEE